jgi:hypothetical protein
VQAAFEEHLGAHEGIMEWPAGSEVVFPDEADLVDTPAAAEFREEEPMEEQDFRFRAFCARGNRLGSEAIHYGRDVDIIRASDGAGEASGAGPDRLRLEHAIFEPEGAEVHDFMGKNIHVLGHRAAGGALPALVAERRILVSNHQESPQESHAGK